MQASEGGDDDQGIPPLRLALAALGPLTTLLQAIKVSSKQVCAVVVAPEGAWLRWEDESKTLQASVQLRSELFSAYDCGGVKRAFGVNFAQLVDTLAVFASASAAPLNLFYPGPDGELQLEMAEAADASGATGQCTLYARLATLEQDELPDMTDYWTEPVSYFLIEGALLKEATEDLEWPGSSVALRLQRDPAAIALSASGTGSLELALPASELSGFQVAGPAVAQRYNYKNLKAAMTHIPAAKDLGAPVSTKVSIDANGLLKVTHMVPLAGRGGCGGPAAAQQGSAAGFTQGLGALATTQAGLDAARVGVLQFVSVPLEDED